MALKELDVSINEGRDSGKTFHLKEWPATRVEDWVLRAVFGLGRAGVEIPPEILQLGAGPTAYAIASQAIKMPSRLGVKLADELMSCVTIAEPKVTRSLVERDIEDFSTRLWLKGQVLKLMFGFFLPAASPSLTPQASGAPSRSEPAASAR
jgi:hypothetical protein